MKLLKTYFKNEAKLYFNDIKKCDDCLKYDAGLGDVHVLYYEMADVLFAVYLLKTEMLKIDLYVKGAAE